MSQHSEMWERLFSSVSCEPSTSFEWTEALTRSHVERTDRFLLLRVCSGTEVTGLLPLVARRVSLLGYPVVMLSPLGELYNTHSDLLSREMSEDTVSAIVSALLALDEPWDVFRMSKLLDGHPFLHHVGSCLANRRTTRQIRTGHGSYFLALPSTYEEYLAKRGSKFRNHLKRSEKKIASHGTAEVLDGSKPSDVANSYERLLQIERASWKHAHGTSISAVKRQSRFYHDLCEGAARRGRLHLQFLTIGGNPVAYNLGYLANGRYSYLKTSYDEQYKPLGVATYLRARLIESLIGSGVTEVDFPAEPYEWERQWTETVRWHKVLSVYRATPAGVALSWIDRLRHRPDRPRRVEHVDPRALVSARLQPLK